MMQQQAGVKPARLRGGNWVRQAEHSIVRIGSLALSVVSGHAVYWLFSAMDGVDKIEPYMTWLTAAAIGLLGYVILRALTHRLLHHEKVWVYIPLCFILIGVETVANFMKAVVGVHDDKWLALCPHPLIVPMTYATYVVLSIMPAFTVFLAYVDMDLERAKQVVGSAMSAFTANKAPMAAVPMAPALKPVSPVQKYVPQQQQAASANTVPNNGQLPFASIPSYPSAAPTQVFPAAQVAQQPQAQGGVFQGIMNNASHWASASNAQRTQP